MVAEDEQSIKFFILQITNAIVDEVCEKLESDILTPTKESSGELINPDINKNDKTTDTIDSVEDKTELLPQK